MGDYTLKKIALALPLSSTYTLVLTERTEAMNETPQMMDTLAAASLIGANPMSLKRSRVNGELYKGIKTPPFVKLGRAVRYHRSDLVDWLKAQASRRTTK